MRRLSVPLPVRERLIHPPEAQPLRAETSHAALTAGHAGNTKTSGAKLCK